MTENKGDLISREALENVFEEHEDRRGDLDCDWRILIDNAPTVELFCSYLSDGEVRQPCVESPCKHERPQGEWITVHYSREELNVPQKASMFDFVKCPFCETIHQGRHNFCSRCGADMRGKED